jgi:hypothetical protein
MSDQRIVARLDFSRGQTQENVALEPDGSADITLAVAPQLALVSLSGEARAPEQLPRPAGGAACPVLRPLLGATALSVGIARDHCGSLYAALCTGTPGMQGIWRMSPSGSMARVAALPADGIRNGCREWHPGRVGVIVLRQVQAQNPGGLPVTEKGRKDGCR